MKILFITGSLPPLKCGIGFYSEKLLPELAKYADVSLLTTTGCYSTLNLKKSTVDNWRIINLFNIYKIAKKTHADCCIIQYPAAGYKRDIGINLAPLIIRLFIKKPVIVTLHEYHGSGILGQLRNLLTVLVANKVIVSNNYDLRSLPRIIRKKTTIVPIGSSIDRGTSLATYEKIFTKNNFSKSRKTGVFFGFLNQNKGLDTLLKSVVDSDSQVLILAGIDNNNAYHKKIAEKVNEMKLKGFKVHVTGYLPDQEVSSVLSGADYFLLPQPLPLTAKSSTAIAAAVHRLPIVSTGSLDITINEPYLNNVNSILLNPMSVTELTKTLNKINANEIDLSVLSKNLGELSEYFSWTKIAKKYIDTIKEAAA